MGKFFNTNSEYFLVKEAGKKKLISKAVSTALKNVTDDAALAGTKAVAKAKSDDAIAQSTKQLLKIKKLPNVQTQGSNQLRGYP